MVLNFIYTDCIDPTRKNGQEIESPLSNRIVLLIMDVYRLAVQFNMARLESLCVQYMNTTICVKNVLEILRNAHKLHLDFIKKFCLEFIVKDAYFIDIISSTEFETLDEVLIVDIIRRKHLPQVKTQEEKLFGKVGTSLEEDLAMFLRSTGMEFCDVDLVLGANVIPAHKAVLAARCAYFEGMFRSFMPRDCKVKVSSIPHITTDSTIKSLVH